MKKGTKVKVDLKVEDARKLGLNNPVEGIGVIEGPYTNGVAGHFINVDGKTVGIPDRLNAVTPIVEKETEQEIAA